MNTTPNYSSIKDLLTRVDQLANNNGPWVVVSKGRVSTVLLESYQAVYAADGMGLTAAVIWLSGKGSEAGISPDEIATSQGIPFDAGTIFVMERVGLFEWPEQGDPLAACNDMVAINGLSPAVAEQVEDPIDIE